jgi:hypothetical protein
MTAGPPPPPPSPSPSPSPSVPSGPGGPRPLPGDGRGIGIIRLSWVGTAAYAVVAVLAAAAPRAPLDLVLIVVCLVLFVVGAGAFAAAYLVAVGRSRYEAIGMGGLFFLAGSAPPAVRRHLLGSVAVEIVIAFATASLGLLSTTAAADNPLAFGLLTPLFGLGLAGLWGARHGVFGPRRTAGVAGGREGAG